MVAAASRSPRPDGHRGVEQAMGDVGFVEMAGPHQLPQPVGGPVQGVVAGAFPGGAQRLELAVERGPGPAR